MLKTFLTTSSCNIGSIGRALHCYGFQFCYHLTFILTIQLLFVADLTTKTVYFTFFRCLKFTSYVQTRRQSWKKWKPTSPGTSSTRTCGSCHVTAMSVVILTIPRGVGCFYGASTPWGWSITLWYFRGTARFPVRFSFQERNIILLVCLSILVVFCVVETLLMNLLLNRSIFSTWARFFFQYFRAQFYWANGVIFFFGNRSHLRWFPSISWQSIRGKLREQEHETTDICVQRCSR